MISFRDEKSKISYAGKKFADSLLYHYLVMTKSESSSFEVSFTQIPTKYYCFSMRTGFKCLQFSVVVE